MNSLSSDRTENLSASSSCLECQQNGSSSFSHLPLVPEPAIYAVNSLDSIPYYLLLFELIPSMKIIITSSKWLKNSVPFVFVFGQQVMTAYANDSSPLKLNLGVGVYRSEVKLISFFLKSDSAFFILLLQYDRTRNGAR